MHFEQTNEKHFLKPVIRKIDNVSLSFVVNVRLPNRIFLIPISHWGTELEERE